MAYDIVSVTGSLMKLNRNHTVTDFEISANTLSIWSISSGLCLTPPPALGAPPTHRRARAPLPRSFRAEQGPQFDFMAHSAVSKHRILSSRMYKTDMTTVSNVATTHTELRLVHGRGGVGTAGQGGISLVLSKQTARQWLVSVFKGLQQLQMTDLFRTFFKLFIAVRVWSPFQTKYKKSVYWKNLPALPLSCRAMAIPCSFFVIY